jgi:indoleamine 2,3-dioxygenase
MQSPCSNNTFHSVMVNSSTEIDTLIPITRDFDVDNRTGFMAPRLPILRLPRLWEPWESILDAAIDAKLQLGDKIGLTGVEAEESREWRAKVRKVRVTLAGQTWSAT